MVSAQFKSHPIQKIPFPQELATFIEAMQPYNIPAITSAPDVERIEALTVLHDCARIDRHRHLHLVAAHPLAAKGQFTCGAPVSVSAIQPILANFLENESKLLRFTIKGWDGKDVPNIELNGDADIHVRVKEIPVALGGDIGAYLELVSKTAAIIVAKFEECVP